MFICLNGKFLPRAKAKISVFDHGFLYGDGVYDTTRTYKGRPWMLKEHLERLRASAEEMYLKYSWSDRQIMRWTKMLLGKNAFDESRIRVMVTRGVNHFRFSSSKKPTCIILAEKLVLQPVKVYTQGVEVISFPFERLLPNVKSMSLLPMILARLEAERYKVFETLLVSRDGYVTEGAMTNVFMIKNGILSTPEHHLLPGLTREVILKLAPGLCERVELEAILLEELYEADECFITSSVKEIVPVVKVDDVVIGMGEVGDITKRFIEEYRKYIYHINHDN